MFKIIVLCTFLLLTQNDIEVNGQPEAANFHMSFKGGYNPYRIFGDVPLPPKGSAFRSKLFGPSCTCMIPETSEAIYVKIKIASFLRINLIRVFGYILHRKHIELNTAYYTSLHFILTCVKLNHIDVISLSDALVDIQFKKPTEQFVKLFGEMEKHLPQYLRCAAGYWKKGIEKKEVDIEKILIPYNDNTVVVSLLEGITPQELTKVSKHREKAVKNTKTEQKLLYDFNPNIVQLYITITNKTNPKLHPWLIAGIIQFFPRTLIQPDFEESIQLLTQYFYQRNITEFMNLTIKDKEATPFDIINLYLKQIVMGDDIPDVIKDSALTIVNNLKHRSPTAVNPHYSSFTFFVQPDNIKVLEMLKYVSKGAFPLEIILAAERVRYYIDQKIIGYFSYMITFNPYLYSSPTEVLIAILDRIMRRQPDLSPEVLDSVGAVYSYLIFKYRYSAMPVAYSTDMTRMNVLIMGLKAPDIQQTIRDQVNLLISQLLQEQIKYSEILVKKVPIYECTTPVICFMHLLQELKRMNNVIGGMVEKNIIFLLNVFEGKPGLPLDDNPPEGQLFPQDLRKEIITRFLNCSKNENNKPTTESTTAETNAPLTTTETTTTTTTQPPPTTPTEGPPQTASTLPPTTPTTPTPPKPEKTTILPLLPFDYLPANESAVIAILQNITVKYGNVEMEQVREMLAILQSSEFKQYFEKNKDHHLTVITFYTGFLQSLNRTHTSETFRNYLKGVVNKLTPVKQHLKDMEIEPSFGEPSMYQLIIALPAPTNDNERKHFELLKEVLLKQELFKIIHVKIQTKELATVGALLNAVLREESKLTDKLTPDQLAAVKYYVGKVKMHGFGEAQIRYTLVTQQTERIEVNISGNFNNAIDFDTLEREDKFFFNKIVDHLIEDRNFLINWTKWQLYPTAAEFTQAVFKRLLDTPSVPANVKEGILKLTPKINFDKNGSLPAYKKTTETTSGR